MKLLPDLRNRIVRDEFVQHHRQPGVSAGHAIQREQLRPQRLKARQQIGSLLPFQIATDEIERFGLA